MADQKLNELDAIEVADGIWWVGFSDREAGFSNNPYLIVDGDESVLFDPGPGHPVFRELILSKLEQVVRPESIRYVVVHHQDPDLCGLIPHIEKLLHPGVVVLASPRTSLFLPYYGIRAGILPVGDGDVLELRSGRRLVFHHLPYLHFAGNMATFDEATGSLFSSDIFAILDRDWRLRADARHREKALRFLEAYAGNREALDYAYEKLSSLPLQRILPQHGGMIVEDDIPAFLSVLKQARPARLLDGLGKTPDAEQSDHIRETGRAFLEQWCGEAVPASLDLDALLDRATAAGAPAVVALGEVVGRKAEELGVTNPLTSGRVHRWDSLRPRIGNLTIDAARRRLLRVQQERFVGGDRPEAAGEACSLLSFTRKAAVLFADIRGFTKWADVRRPEEVMRRLNHHHEHLSWLIVSHGGRVNKLMGDGLLAFFPESRAADCCRAGWEILRVVREEGLLPTGVGCAFGDVVIGDVGEEIRHDYTLIGAPVNAAARACSAADSDEMIVTRCLIDALSAEERCEALPGAELSDVVLHAKPRDPEIPALRIRRVPQPNSAGPDQHE